MEELSASSTVFCREFRVETRAAAASTPAHLSRTSSEVSLQDVPSPSGAYARSGSALGAAAAKPLMVFEVSRKTMGCTVLLQVRLYTSGLQKWAFCVLYQPSFVFLCVPNMYQTAWALSDLQNCRLAAKPVRLFGEISHQIARTFNQLILSPPPPRRAPA